MKKLAPTLIAGALALAFSAPLAHAAPIEIHRSTQHYKTHTTPVVSRVNLNTATRAEIARLPYISDRTARRIIASRPIRDARTLVRRGVLTQAQYDKIHLRISTADADEAVTRNGNRGHDHDRMPNQMVSDTHHGTPDRDVDHTTPIVDRLNLNTASRSALMELPGIDGRAADRIISARPVEDAKDLVDRGVLTQAQYDRIHLRVSTRLEGHDNH